MSSSRTPSHPLVVVLSAPSGAGKTTLATRLLADRKDLVRSVSCTTRKPRGTEADGGAYHFVSLKEFERRVENREFLEHAVVHGSHYGTLRQTVEEALGRNLSVLLVIDVQGARQIRDIVGQLPPESPVRRGWVDIFVMPPSSAVLKKRLERRGEDAPDVIRKRLKNAEGEMESAKEFKYAIVNDDLEKAVRQLEEILDHEIQAAT